MPRLSIADCELVLRALEEQPMPSAQAQRAAGRLRQRLQQAKRGVTLPERSRALPMPQEADHGSACVLHVCTSCRPSGTPREPRQGRPGFVLHQQLREAIEASPLRRRVEVRPAECLSVCPRPCGVALSSPGAWTYVFGDQRPSETTRDIVDCVSLYLDSPHGFMPRDRRPEPLRASILARVPGRLLLPPAD